MDDTMSLKGGINMYVMVAEDFNSRYISQTPPLGRRVKFINKNGWDWDLETARKMFTEGQILTIKEIYVGRNSSEVEFVTLPGKKFNTVMFVDIGEESIEG